MIEELQYAGRPCEIIAWAKGDERLAMNLWGDTIDVALRERNNRIASAQARIYSALAGKNNMEIISMIFNGMSAVDLENWANKLNSPHGGIDGHQIPT